MMGKNKMFGSKNTWEKSLEIPNFTASTKGCVEIFLANEGDFSTFF
jgi:hypothetical protein